VARQLGRLRQIPQAIGDAKAVAYAVIVFRQDVLASELEHQHHLHRPRSDAADARQPLDDRGIVQRFQRARVGDDAFESVTGQIFERDGLRERKADCAQRRLAGRDDALGRGKEPCIA